MAARSYNVQGFNFAKGKIKELKPATYSWLCKIPSHMWSRHGFDTRLKNDHVTNNITESFNHWIGDLRGKPILTLLDGLRTKLMSRMRARYERSLRWSNAICDNVVTKLNVVKENSVHFHLTVSSSHEFQVKDEGMHYIVNLNSRSCDCKEWDISGIPCKHAALGIVYKMEALEEYTDVSFFTFIYLKAYMEVIHPIPNATFWPADLDPHPPTFLPPKVKKLPGRSKKNRRKEPGELTPIQSKRSITLKCGKCGGLGHNKRTCNAGTSKTGVAMRGFEGNGLDDDFHIGEMFGDLKRREKSAVASNFVAPPASHDYL